MKGCAQGYTAGDCSSEWQWPWACASTVPSSSFSHGYFPTQKSCLVLACPRLKSKPLKPVLEPPTPRVWSTFSPSPNPSGPAPPPPPARRYFSTFPESLSQSPTAFTHRPPLSHPQGLSVFQGLTSSRLPTPRSLPSLFTSTSLFSPPNLSSHLCQLLSPVPMTRHLDLQNRPTSTGL